MSADPWVLHVCSDCWPPRMAQRHLIMVDNIGVRRVYSCTEHGLISINAVVDYQRSSNEQKEEDR